MSQNYEDLLKYSFNELPEDKLLPVGPWRLRGRNAAFMAPRTPDSKPQYLFYYQAKEPMEGVDETAYDELVASGYDIGSNDIRFTVFLNVVSHLAKHGIEIDGGIPVGEAILKGLKQFKGTEVLANLTLRTFVNSEGVSDTENKPKDFEKVPD